MLLSLLLTPRTFRTGSFRLLIVMIICENQELSDDYGGSRRWSFTATTTGTMLEWVIREALE
jgi:hypothetical protein